MSTAGLVEPLRALDATVTVGLRCLSPRRAEVIRSLQSQGVRVSAWLLLEPEQGYFATFDNGEAVSARVETFVKWSELHGLRFERLGLDFEPALAELEGFFVRPGRALWQWVRRARDRSRLDSARRHYRGLVSRLRSAGWKLEGYQFPLLAEDRTARSDFFQRFLSGLDLGDEVETVLMAYTSLLGPLGPGLLARWSAMPGGIAVGSTGGGVDPFPKLSWESLSRDLRVAGAGRDEVSVFSLEGCVAQGMLSRLVTFDWNVPAEVPVVQRVGASAAGVVAQLASRLLR